MDEDEPLFKVKRRKVSHRSVIDLDEVNGDEVGSSAVIRGRVSSLGIKGLKVERPLMVIDDENVSHQPRNELSHGLSNRFVGPEKTHPTSTNVIDRRVSKAVYTRFERESTAESVSKDNDQLAVADERKKSTEEQTPSQVLSEVPVEQRHLKQSEQGHTRKRKPKIRLGWDGKPMKPRIRKGPSIEDVERGKMVEQLLHEQGPNEFAATPINLGNNEKADAELADEFQSHFMNAIAEKAQRQAAKNGERSTAMSGPRMGGGRSARAKMAQQAKTTPNNGK